MKGGGPATRSRVIMYSGLKVKRPMNSGMAMRRQRRASEFHGPYFSSIIRPKKPEMAKKSGIRKL